jgi:HlyD family secretion protein
MAEPTTTKVSDEADLEDFLGAPAAKPWYKRPLYIVGAVVTVLALLLLSRCFVGEGEGGYATAEVRRGQLSVTVSATGNLQPTNQVEVGSEQSGLVTQVYVDNNDRVVAGQPLARLDTSRLQDTILQAQAGLAAAQAQVATAEATAAQARAGLARQEEVFRLSGGRVPSETELDAARAENRRAQAGVRSAQASVAQARAQVSSAQTNLSKATLYSPVTGVVLSRQIDPGQTVAASFQAPVLFTIAEDLGAMQLEVRVDEADVAQVQQGQRATFTVDAYPGRTFPATVTRVDVGANASGTAATTAAAGTGSVIAYTAELAVDNPEQLLRPGMTATAEIVTTERRNVLLVPNAALRWSPERDAAQAGQGGGITSVLVPQRGRGGRGGNRAERQVEIGRGSRQSVYVVGEDGNPVRVQVVVGESNGSVTEVTGGELREGQEVITARLAAGQTQEKSEGGERKGRGNRGGGDGDGQGNGAEPAPAPPPAQRQPAQQNQQQPAAAAPPAGAAQEGARGGRRQGREGAAPDG